MPSDLSRAALLAGCVVLASCSAPPPDQARASAAAPTSSRATTGPVIAGTPTTAPRVGPVQEVLTPAPTAERPTVTTGTGGSTSGFAWTARAATAADLGSSWREGCPVGPSALRLVSLTHDDAGGRVRTGTLVIHRDIEAATRAAFAALFDQRFPITSITSVTAYGSDDDASMAADNTSAFNCRYAVTGSATRSWSKHADGRAIDINPRTNPYVLDADVLPPNGAEYADRGVRHPGGLYPGGAALAAFTDNGFEWGGTWSDPDYQHLER